VTGPLPIRSTGPALRAVVTMQLRAEHGSVATPQPTMEYGGLPYCPAGSVVRINIGDAEHCYPSSADKIAGAVRDAAEIEIAGTFWQGVAETHTVLTAAIIRARRRLTG
jgi:hypothetical protein